MYTFPTPLLLRWIAHDCNEELSNLKLIHVESSIGAQVSQGQEPGELSFPTIIMYCNCKQ